jgi:2-oxoisovalerate dehydrogenase E1 component beta subunit
VADDTWFATASAATPPIEDPTTSSYLEAIGHALGDEMELDPSVVLLGQDIGVMGGAFRATRGLWERFGDDRVIDTPIAEAAMVGAGIGLAISGWRPVVELQFADFISCAYDQLVTEAAKLHYRFGIGVPLVVRAPSGGGVGAGPFHSQSPEGTFAHVPGLKVVCPGTVQDAYDLLRSALRDPNPVLFFEHKALYRSERAPLVRHGALTGLGGSVSRRHGADVTVVTYGAMVRRCLDAARTAASTGVSAEVIDLRCLQPLDLELVIESVGRTGRLVVVHEDTRTCGIGAEVAAVVAERSLFHLDAPILRVTAPDTPVPFAQPLEEVFIPSADRIERAILEAAAC